MEDEQPTMEVSADHVGEANNNDQQDLDGQIPGDDDGAQAE